MNNPFIYFSKIFSPEVAHRLTVRLLAYNKLISYKSPNLPVELAGIKFKNPLGLAAGFDKSGECYNGIYRLGFSCVELGTVTPFPQKGNAKPRVFRLIEDEAIINRYGFNNEGMELVARRLNNNLPKDGILGINIGPNKESKNFAEDYRIAASCLASLGDYITINISSPNTPGLRKLQENSYLEDVIDSTFKGVSIFKKRTPVFLKISPDISLKKLEKIIYLAIKKKISALIISNTSIQRSRELLSINKDEIGGISGNPLFIHSTKLLEQARIISKGNIGLIGVGGISSANQAYIKILVGANLIQVYTGLIYNGPKMAFNILEGLSKLLKRDGFRSISDAVGILDFKNAMKIKNLNF